MVILHREGQDRPAIRRRRHLNQLRRSRTSTAGAKVLVIAAIDGTTLSDVLKAADYGV
jgi:ABC-type xylose transport system substrate-binding protein